MSGCPFHRAAAPPAASPAQGYGSASGAGYGAQRPPAAAQPASPAIVPRIGEDDLECPVCLRLLIEPMSLPCGHSFCSPCLRSAHLQGQHEVFRCPMCRCEVADLNAIKVNALLAALVEKFLPDEATKRRQEAAQEREQEADRYSMRREISFKVNVDERGAAEVICHMASASRCPMHQGSRVPICFYVARAQVEYPAGWTSRAVQFVGQGDSLRMPGNRNRRTEPVPGPPVSKEEAAAMSVGVLKRALQARGIDYRQCLEKSEFVELLANAPSSGPAAAAADATSPAAEAESAADEEFVEVELHFQPRFQIAPMKTRLKLEDEATGSLFPEFDARVVHR
eukprot:TRINITY_DN65982_c0_g1_i1.p1 TRINITY_DN65982_c0_g1~~TRINITY_DN65982_c0_g1_i1.p1  ORF type:complete len:339 (+),score=84.59 TRINITY_DN65982_c0_g1_i1:156-1172(+)